jgi:predicted  nucleic acid-binding Zn-ribbon protein
MAKTVSEATAEKKLRALFKLQLIDSKIDKIKTVRGELPLEVEDLEDDIQGLATRTQKIEEEIASINNEISNKNNLMLEANELIKKYEEQQKNVRNNREFDALTKEIEFQRLEIELAQKRIKEAKEKLELKKETLNINNEKLASRRAELEGKKEELEAIVAETKKEEEVLSEQSAKAEKDVEERLLIAYKRIRTNVRNGLAVVAVDRDACGGCFNKIPPQRQLDIRTRKKLIVCEHCGRVLVDPELAEEISAKI